MRYRIRYPELPLAVYREVAAHLEQVDRVKTELVSQQSQQFDYRLSQVDSLWVQHPDDLDSTCRKRVEQILAYYSDRYGAWEVVESDTVESNLVEGGT
ncbi:hypothetical protein K9N68_24500 [Kovacikia minuta CCNUW1]|uniref:hypothetical protein n=1 Tax=Kovacikia minuta TaxID=2931930 RepID=UPI001CCE39A1|nr:hypothetical protein [Kovacikia minuta]UBF24794.1 hypothetical protein K9N68_24500 [Kovacikia minuta CCNUW1]